MKLSRLCPQPTPVTVRAGSQAYNSDLVSVTSQQWRTLFAAHTGYLLDALDVLLYVFALNTLRQEFHFSNATAGLIGSFTLLASALGGILAGLLSDRVGRARALMYTILVYSIGSAGTATARSVPELLFWRGIVGIGLGGEWAAGAVLVAESWPRKYRDRAMAVMQSGWSIGYLLAAGVTALVLPRFGWRALFLVGILPALLALWIRRGVQEPALWQRGEAQPLSTIFRAPFLSRTLRATALSTSVLFAYWGLFTWLPGYLSAPVSAGGAGLSILRTSAAVVPVQLGALAGYLTFGWLAGWIGRRTTFVIYMLCAAALIPVYTLRNETVLLAVGPLIGFFGTGYFSLFGAMLAELYPSSIRGAAQGFTYNVGRGLSALAPLTIGVLADRHGVGSALTLNAAFFLVAAVLVLAFPRSETAYLTD